MKERLQKAAPVITAIVGVIVGIATVLGLIFGRTVDTRLSNVETDLGTHTDNTAIHRTAEESRVVERADADFKQFVRERLISIENRIDNMERRQ